MPAADRAVVTGGAGFIGSHLVEHLLGAGTEVLVVDDLSTGLRANLPSNVRFLEADIADAARLDFRAWRPRVVYHLAAQSSVPRSVADPGRDAAVNVEGTRRVLDAARAAGAARVAFVSSGGAVYGSTSRAATERTRPAPISPYGINKEAAEREVARSGMAAAIVRPANVYGPRQRAGSEGAVIPAFIERALATGSLTIHGDGRQSRDFIHVRDVVAALVLLAREDAPTGIWNISSGRSITIAELARVIEAAVGRPLVRLTTPPRAGDVPRSAISPRRLRSLGWRPEIRLRQGIDELVDEALAHRAAQEQSSRPAG